MKRYAVAYFSNFEGDLTLEIIEALTMLEAATQMLRNHGWNFEINGVEVLYSSIEELIENIESVGDDWIKIVEI